LYLQCNHPDRNNYYANKINKYRPTTKEEDFMNRTKFSKTGFVLGTTLLGMLTGCIGYVEGPRERVYVQPPSVQVETAVVVQDDYVYYPSYQVYYSSNRRQYIYREGHSWVTRPAPPRVSADVLFASPSVRLNFHDSPANHHTAVVRQYPTHWAPPGSSHGNKEGHDESNQKGRKGHD